MLFKINNLIYFCRTIYDPNCGFPIFWLLFLLKGSSKCTLRLKLKLLTNRNKDIVIDLRIFKKLGWKLIPANKTTQYCLSSLFLGSDFKICRYEDMFNVLQTLLMNLATGLTPLGVMIFLYIRIVKVVRTQVNYQVT